MSKAQLPPVPPENRSPHGGGNNADGGELNPRDAKAAMKDRAENPDQRGEQGNIAQNTRNQGYQQDR